MDAGNQERQGVTSIESKGPTREFQISYEKIWRDFLPSELQEVPGPVKILSVACGFGLELKSLKKIFDEVKKPVEIEGIEKQSVGGTRLFNPDIPPENFHQADATDPNSFGNRQWDLVILRNPQVDPRGITMREEWVKILENSVKAVAENGFLFLTTFTPKEMEAVHHFLSQQADLKSVVEPQDITRGMLANFPMRENKIALYKKISPQAELNKSV